MKRALFFTPYLDSLGGGEVYTLEFAQCLYQMGFNVELAWKDDSLNQLYQERFGFDISKYRINVSAYELFTSKKSLLQSYQLTSKYDVVFFLSDGSIPFLFGKKNFLHFQVPFSNINGSVVNRLKLHNQTVICNSAFTKQVIDNQLGIRSQVLYPPVNLKKPSKKDKLILHVGRFTDAMHNKQQDILVAAFKQLVDDGLRGWKLLLIGNDHEGKTLVDILMKQSDGYPIEIVTNADLETLNHAYAKAMIYWHATGIDIDETNQPEKVEHFGISTVEAMSAGCIPVVINKGGQKEIVVDKESGFLFSDQAGLIRITQKLVDLKEDKLNEIQLAAKKRAQQFSCKSFCKKIKSELAAL